jgi:hypothetical protein
MASFLKAFGFNCSLKNSKSSEKSSADVLLRQFFDALAAQGVDGEFVRAADFNIKPGVKSNEGPGDDWSKIARAPAGSPYPGDRLADLAGPTFKYRQTRA